MTTNCGKCGRPLKDPKSIECGFGPTCWANFQAEQATPDRNEQEAVQAALKEEQE